MEEELKERLLQLLKQHFMPIAIGSIGIILLGIGFVTLFQDAPKQQIVLSEGESDNKVEEKLVVDVSGAVQKPGVYSLPASARMQDALIAAGGLAPDADRGYIARTINLAAKLTDGSKLYIPFAGEQTVAGSTTSQEASQAKINLNSASESQLDALWGVGPATAAKIISNRPYANIEEVVTKKAVSQSTYEKIKDLIYVY